MNRSIRNNRPWRPGAIRGSSLANRDGLYPDQSYYWNTSAAAQSPADDNYRLFGLNNNFFVFTDSPTDFRNSRLINTSVARNFPRLGGDYEVVQIYINVTEDAGSAPLLFYMLNGAFVDVGDIEVGIPCKPGDMIAIGLNCTTSATLGFGNIYVADNFSGQQIAAFPYSFTT